MMNITIHCLAKCISNILNREQSWRIWIYIKKLITLSGSASLTVLLLMEITIVYAIFKYRQLDKYIKKNSNTES